MVKNVKYPLAMLALVVTFLLLCNVAAADTQPPCHYFETGFHVCGDFLRFFRARGGEKIFGYPISRAFEDPDRGMTVQYFQNVRMELHPGNSDPYRVQLGLLVDELGYRYPPASPEQIPPFNNDLHHYFPETGHVVSYAFLDYFRENGELDIFGYPRSEFMYEDGYIVQYFQRARMVWHPEIVSGPQMHLTPLGEIYIERLGIPEKALETETADMDLIAPAQDTDFPTPTPVPPVTKLYVSASVRYVITGREGTQTVFVYVTDQQQKPIEGANVKIVVDYPSSDDQLYNFDPTNPSGFAALQFEIKPTAPGEKVVINVTVTYRDLTGTTQTFFLPWW